MITVHRYLRAIGFSKVKKRDELQALISEVVEQTILDPDKLNKKEGGRKEQGYVSARDIAADEEDRVYAELSLDFVHGAGICVRGEFDEDNRFLYEYYFPYLEGSGITSYEDVSVERHADKESYAGVCDDIKVGMSLIFYLKNKIPYIKAMISNQLPVRGTSLTLSALSVNGTIVLPIQKNEEQMERVKQASATRSSLMAAARKGDEDAIETLTLEDMDMYTTISRRIQKEDVFSLVDTYFMPYGVECDQYSILGEIMEFRTDRNRITGEEIFFMTIECNEVMLEVCINREDLYGEPAAGRRFKGVVWLQGCIEFPQQNF